MILFEEYTVSLNLDEELDCAVQFDFGYQGNERGGDNDKDNSSSNLSFDLILREKIERLDHIPPSVFPPSFFPSPGNPFASNRGQREEDNSIKMKTLL